MRGGFKVFVSGAGPVAMTFAGASAASAQEPAPTPTPAEQAAGWKVFKSNQPGPNNTAVYIFRIDPVVKDAEYDISRLIAEVFPVEVQELFQKYKDAFAGRAITYLNKNMSMQ